MKTRLDTQDMAAFEPDAKIGILATIGPRGLPHLTLITTIKARSPTELIWGQFCEGLSKHHVRSNPRVGFLVMTLSREYWTGRARWTRVATEGEDYVAFNKQPMFRYNSYFGIHSVHYMDLLAVSEKQGLPISSMLAGTALARMAGPVLGVSNPTRALKPWACSLLNAPTTLRFASFVGPDGFPEIATAVAGAAAGRGRLLLSSLGGGASLRHLPDGSVVALLALNAQTESVLLRGKIRRMKGLPGMRVLDLDWVYNSMPPRQGQVFPPRLPVPVTEF